MSNLEEQLDQCGKPTSERGAKLVKSMNKSHYSLTSWGLEKINIAAEDLILDIGCGGGRTVARLAEIATRGKVYGIDHSQDCVSWSVQFNQKAVDEGRVSIIHSGVEKMPFDNHYFDLVVAVETIYFWPDILACFEEVRRVLNSNGRFLIINEMYLSEAFRERNEECMATGKMIIYSPGTLRDLLKKAGFSAISIDVVEEKNWLCCLSSK